MERPALPIDQSRWRAECSQPFIGGIALEVTFIILLLIIPSVEDIGSRTLVVADQPGDTTDKAPQLQGAPKMQHSNWHLLPAQEVKFHFFTCVLKSEF